MRDCEKKINRNLYILISPRIYDLIDNIAITVDTQLQHFIDVVPSSSIAIVRS